MRRSSHSDADPPPHSADAVVDRLRDVLELDSDAQLGRALGLRESAPGNWRARGSVPYSHCVEVAAQRGVSLDWLLLGLGAPGEVRERGPPPYASAPPGCAALEVAVAALAQTGHALTAEQLHQAAELVQTHGLSADALADVLRLLHGEAGVGGGEGADG